MKEFRMYANNKNNSKILGFSTVCDRMIKNIIAHTTENNSCDEIHVYSLDIEKNGKIDTITVTNTGDGDYMVCASNYSVECTATSIKRAITEIVESVANEFFTETTETTETIAITDENGKNYTLDEMYETIDNTENYKVKTFKAGNGETSIIIRIIGCASICLLLWNNIDDKLIDYVEFYSTEYKNMFKKWLKYIE